MTTTRATDTSFHLAGNFRPVTDELAAVDLPVTGHIPTELEGTFVRNGPNPIDGTSSHWFLGNGMVHGVRLQGGRAGWYRNRYVRTKRLSDGAPSIGPDGTRDFTAGAANTHVIRHRGRILALDEASFPYELTLELETVGPFDFDQRLRGPMTAHPKICPLSGELHFFGYDFAPPYLTYHVADAAGTLITSRVVDVPGATMMHDFNLTERFVVFMDLPAVFDLDLALSGTMPYRFDPSYGARFGVLRRDEPHGVVRWFDIEPCYVFHQMNAHDDGTSITIDAVRHTDLWFEDEATPGNLWRWSINLTRGTVIEQQLDDLPCEFPRVDDRLVSRPAPHGWVTSTPRHHPDSVGAITVYDLLDAGTKRAHSFGPERVPSEAVFAPANPDADHGWLLTYAYDARTDRSDLVIIDIDEIDDEPVATVHLPSRVPFGFHGSWFADTAPTDGRE
jgi:carotenoid cleavage dioxygenase